MKGKTLVTIIICAILTVTLSSCGSDYGKSNGNNPKYVWKMALQQTEGSNAYDAAKIFADKMYKLTDGQVRVDLYGGASLGSTTEILEGMPVGMADIMVESLGTLAPFSKKANIEAMPYMITSYDHFMKVWNGKLGEEIKEEVGKDTNLKLMGAVYRGPRIVTATKEMKTIKDFKGFKLRAPALDMYLKTWKWMKAAPMPLAFSETYTAIQQKTVNGQENPYSDSYNSSMAEVCDYWINTNHVYGCNLFIMDQKYFNKLPRNIQKAVEESTAYASKIQSEKQVELDKQTQAKLKKAGKHIINVDTDKFVEYFKNFAKENYPEFEDWYNRAKALNPDK